ncbi:MAG: radical SAM protein [Lachnospiraceae bacterium]|nr:radical SAM protein [Lachnospiraceae bacterium]
MSLQSKAEILEILQLPYQEYRDTVAPAARQLHREHNSNVLTVTSMLGYSNVCKNQCLYCGMRAGNNTIPRYRKTPEEILTLVKSAHAAGLRRLFLISGEDPKFGFDALLSVVSEAKKLGMTWVSLACGEYDSSQYQELRAAGVDEYVMKFEMSQPEVFNRLNPSTSFQKRMRAIEAIQASSMALASGNIVDYPGQTLTQIAEDIHLMQALNISWAPVIPYMPAKNTPLAEGAYPGRQELILKEISILRLSMPDVRITAQQPGSKPEEGLASREGNLAALEAGADLLFADLLPAAQAQDFHVIDNRILLGLDHVRAIAETSGMTLWLT